MYDPDGIMYPAITFQTSVPNAGSSGRILYHGASDKYEAFGSEPVWADLTQKYAKDGVTMASEIVAIVLGELRTQQGKQQLPQGP